MATYEEIRAVALALRLRAAALQTELTPVVAAAGGWTLDGDDSLLPSVDAVKTQLLAYEGLTVDPVRIADDVRAVKSAGTTSESQSDISVLADILGMSGNVSTLLGDPGSHGNLVSEAAIRAAFGEICDGGGMLINGNMRNAQRGNSFDISTYYPNNHGAYTLDRWMLCSDGNNIASVVQSGESPQGHVSGKSLALTVVSAGKFGICQMIESSDTGAIVGGAVTLSFSSNASRSLSVKAAILSWSGVPDLITESRVSAWNDTGEDPSWGSSWSCLARTECLVGPEWERFFLSGFVPVETTSNIAVLLWCDEANCLVGDVVRFTNVKLEPGSVAHAFKARPDGAELALCQRFYETNYLAGVTPGTDLGTGDVSGCFVFRGTDVNTIRKTLSIQTTKRIPPSVTLFSTTGSPGAVYDRISSADISASVLMVGRSSFGVEVSLSESSCFVQGFFSADAEL